MQTLKKRVFCKILLQISCFFYLFSTKNAENDCFNQRLECAAPKRWSKYTAPTSIQPTIRPRIMAEYRVFFQIARPGRVIHQSLLSFILSSAFIRFLSLALALSLFLSKLFLVIVFPPLYHSLLIFLFTFLTHEQPLVFYFLVDQFFPSFFWVRRRIPTLTRT